MSKKDRRQPPRIIKIQNSFQFPGGESPVEHDLANKRMREEIVLKFLAEGKKNVKG